MVFGILICFSEERPKLAELLLRFYEVQGKEREFLQWALDVEVSNTKRPEELLREGTMGAHFMYYHFFGDTGLRYLQTFILPLVNEICAHSTLAPLEIDERLGTKGVNVEANLNVILDAIARFTKNIYDATLLCPLLIRYGIRHLHEVVETTYTETETKRITISVFMLRFVCPAIISPHKYGLMDEPPLLNAAPGLLMAAKILQSVANGIPWSESELKYVKPINKFIRRQIPFMTAFMEKLWDQEEIERGFRTLEASVVNLATAEEQEEATEALCSYLDMKESFFEFEGQTDQLKSLKDHEGWQPVKFKDQRVSLFTMKADGLRLFMTRSAIRCPMEKLFRHLHEFERRQTFWKFAFPSIISIETVQTYNDTHSEYRVVTKLPFPYANREWIIARHDYLNRHDALLLEFSIDRSDQPTTKANARGHLISSGWFLDESADGTQTLIQQVVKADYRSKLPNWVFEKLGKDQAKALANMKKFFEKDVVLASPELTSPRQRSSRELRTSASPRNSRDVKAKPERKPSSGSGESISL